MSIMLDLIGSVVIAGFVILMALQFNSNLGATADASMADLNVQQSMVDIVQTLEADFRKIGFGVPETQHPIIDTSATSIQFMADMDRNGVVDTVRWWTGPVLTTYENPNIRILYRQVNHGDSVGAALGLTEFRLRYLDQDGQTPVSMSAIFIIEVTLQVESPYRVKDEVKLVQDYQDMGYAVAFWRQTRLASRNIKRHG
jgi:hypothetical protein